VCTATPLAHMEIAESYSTEAFLLALRRFMALHGAPKRFQSDQGTQLVAASKQVKAWDWSRVRQQADGVGAEWHVVPTGGQHFNGQAERMIGILKKCLEGALTGKRCTMGEMGTIVAVEVPQVRFNEAPKLTQRLQFIEDTKKQFWHKWMSQVFGGRMLSHKWTKKERDVAIGDVVLLAEAENDDPTYRMGIVDRVKPGEDGHVRDSEHQINQPGKGPGERSPPKITTRPIYKIVVIVPVDYVFEDDFGSRTGRPGLPMLTQAEAGNPEGGAPAPPDPDNQDTDRSKPAEETTQGAGTKQTQREAKEEAADEPGPVAAAKRGPGRPRKEAEPNAGPRATQPASGPEANERPRRQAAIRAEENMRGGKSRNPEAWPLLQARANQRWHQRRN
jgi:hypothetical protein